MDKVYFCKKNKCNSNKEIKALQSSFPKVKIQQKGCLGKCKVCKRKPFSKVDGKVIKADETPELYLKLYKKIIKEQTKKLTM